MGDTEYEADETFAVNLSQLSGATLSNNETESTLVAEIENDDILEEDPSIRINAGGQEYTDISGQSWSATGGFSSGKKYSTHAAIAQTEDDFLY